MQSDNLVDVNSLIKENDSNEVDVNSLIKDNSEKKNPVQNDLYSGQRPASYPLQNGSGESVQPESTSTTRTPVQKQVLNQKPSPLNNFGLPTHDQLAQGQVAPTESTAAVQPQQTAEKVDYDQNHAARVKERQDFNNRAVDDATKRYLALKGINAEQGSAIYNQQKAKFQQQVDNGDAIPSVGANGEVGLKRKSGIIENFKNAWNDAIGNDAEAQDFANNMTMQQRVEYANKHPELQQNSEYVGDKPTVGGLIGGFAGGAAPFMGKAAAGALIGTGAAAIAPETGGASLAGLPTAMAFLFTAPDMINHGVTNETLREYRILKQQYPDKSDEELMTEAFNKGKWIGGSEGVVNNALLMGTGMKNPVVSEGENVLTNTIKQVAKSGTHLGAVNAATTAAGEEAANLAGVKTDQSQILNDATQSFGEGLKTGSLLTLMMHAPNIVKSAAKFALLKSEKPSNIEGTLQANENAGTIPEGTTQKVMSDLKDYQEALKGIPDGLSPESQSSIAGLIQKRNNLVKAQEKANTTIPAIKSFYKDQIDAIDNQVSEIIRTNKPFEHEIDEATAEPYQKPTYDGVAQQQVKDLAEKIAKGKPITDPQDLQAKANFPDELKAELQQHLKEDQKAGKEGTGVQENINEYLKQNPENKPAEPVSSSDVPRGGTGKSGITLEAQDLLDGLTSGSKPTFITKNLERIAKDNGIEVTDKMSADDVINALKEKQQPVPSKEPIAEGLPTELKGEISVSNTGFGGEREHTSRKVNLEDLKVLPNGIETAKKTIETDKSFKPSKEPVVVGVDINTGEKQLLDGYHRYLLKDGKGQVDAKFIPMKDGDIISFDEAKKEQQPIKEPISEPTNKVENNSDNKQKEVPSNNEKAKDIAKAEKENAKQLKTEAADREKLATSLESRNRTYRLVNEIDEPTDARGIALQYFAGGNKVDAGEMANEVTGKRKSSMNRTGKTSDASGNTMFEKDGRTVDQVAHSLWDNLPEHIQDGITTQDIRNELLDVMGSHSSRFDAAKEYVENYHPEYIQAKHDQAERDHWEAEHKKEVAAEEKWLQDEANKQKEFEESPEYIKQYLNESRATSQNAGTGDTGSKAESVSPSGSKASNEESGSKPKGSEQNQPKSTDSQQQGSESKQLAGDVLRKFADFVEKGKINKLGGFKTSTGFDAVWDSSLTVVAEALRTTGKVADAIQAGLEHVKASDWYKNLTDKKDFDEKYVAHLEGEYKNYEQSPEVEHPDYKPIGETTAIKNAIVDQERAKEGKSALEVTAGKGDEKLYEETKTKIESGEIPIQHVRDIAHALATDDHALLTNLSNTEIQNALKYDRVTLKKEAKEIDSKIIGASDSEKPDLLFKKSQNELLQEDNDMASRKSGTELSSAFRARQHEIDFEYSFAGLVNRYKAAGDGNISDAVKEKFRELSKKIEDQNEELAAREKAQADAELEIQHLKDLNEELRNKKEQETNFEEIKKEAKREYKAKVNNSRSEIIKERKSIQDNIKDKWKRFNSQMNAGVPLPVELIPDLVKLAKNYIKEGLLEGKVTLDSVVDKVHEFVSEFVDGVDKATVRDAITGYGKIKKPNPDIVEKTFRDITAQGRLVSSIERANEGEPPLRSGAQRDEPSKEQRDLQKQLNKALKDNNIQVVSPEKQLKTALDGAKTRLENQIEDLTQAIKTKTPIEKDNSGIEYTPELKKLKEQRDQLQNEYDEIFKTDKGLTDEQKIERAAKAVKKNIEEIERRINEKDFSIKKPEKLKSEYLDGLQEQRKELRKAYKDLMEAEGELNRRKLEALKKNIAKRTAYLEEIKRTGNIDKFLADRVKKKTVLDKDVMEAQAKKNKVQNDIDNLIEQRKFENMNKWQKGLHWGGRFAKGVLISNPVVLARIAGSVVLRGIYKAPTEVLKYGLSKLPFTKGEYAEAIRTRQDLADHLITYYSTLFSKENLEGFKFAFKHHNTAEDLALGKNYHQLPIPDIKVKGIKTFIQHSFFTTLKALDKNASIHGAEKSLVSKPEFEAYKVTILRNLIREGITPEELGQPTLMEAANQLAFQKSLRAKFMQENKVVGAQRAIEEYFVRTGHPEIKEVINGVLPVTKISSNYIAEAFTKLPVIGLTPEIGKIAKATFKSDVLTEKEKSNLLRTLTYQGVGMFTYALGFALHSHFNPFYKSSSNKYAHKKNEDEETNSLLTLFETLSHSPDALVFQAGVSHGWVWQQYDEEHPDEKSMTQFMGSMPGALVENARNIVSSSPYLQTSSTVLDPIVTGKDFGKASANFVKSRFPLYTTSKEIAEGKIPVLNKLGIKSGHEEKVQPYQVGLYPKGFVDNIGIGIPGWREKILKKLYEEKTAKKPPKTYEQKVDAIENRRDKKEKMSEFEQEHNLQ